MSRHWYVGLLLASLLPLGGCRKEARGNELPPATGPGAVPLPSVPLQATGTHAAGSDAENDLVITGTARAIREAKLGPKGSGVIAAMLVEEGDKVKKGQVLFRLDGANQSLGVGQAEAALATALVGESTAKMEYDRTKALFEAGSVPPAMFDGVKARYDAAKAMVEQARAAVSSAKQFQADTAVVSPIAGVVSMRRASVGETVTMMPPTVVLIVQDITELEVRGRIPETMLSKVKPGTPIRVRFPSVNVERVVPIERINPSVDPMTRTIEVVALVPN